MENSKDISEAAYEKYFSDLDFSAVKRYDMTVKIREALAQSLANSSLRLCTPETSLFQKIQFLPSDFKDSLIHDILEMLDKKIDKELVFKEQKGDKESAEIYINKLMKDWPIKNFLFHLLLSTPVTEMSYKLFDAIKKTKFGRCMQSDIDELEQKKLAEANQAKSHLYELMRNERFGELPLDEDFSGIPLVDCRSLVASMLHPVLGEIVKNNPVSDMNKKLSKVISELPEYYKKIATQMILKHDIFDSNAWRYFPGKIYEPSRLEKIRAQCASAFLEPDTAKRKAKYKNIFDTVYSYIYRYINEDDGFDSLEITNIILEVFDTLQNGNFTLAPAFNETELELIFDKCAGVVCRAENLANIENKVKGLAERLIRDPGKALHLSANKFKDGGFYLKALERYLHLYYSAKTNSELREEIGQKIAHIIFLRHIQLFIHDSKIYYLQLNSENLTSENQKILSEQALAFYTADPNNEVASFNSRLIDGLNGDLENAGISLGKVELNQEQQKKIAKFRNALQAVYSENNRLIPASTTEQIAVLLDHSNGLQQQVKNQSEQINQLQQELEKLKAQLDGSSETPKWGPSMFK